MEGAHGLVRRMDLSIHHSYITPLTTPLIPIRAPCRRPTIHVPWWHAVLTCSLFYDPSSILPLLRSLTSALGFADTFWLATVRQFLIQSVKSKAWSTCRAFCHGCHLPLLPVEVNPALRQALVHLAGIPQLALPDLQAAAEGVHKARVCRLLSIGQATATQRPLPAARHLGKMAPGWRLPVPAGLWLPAAVVDGCHGYHPLLHA